MAGKRRSAVDQGLLFCGPLEPFFIGPPRPSIADRLKLPEPVLTEFQSFISGCLSGVDYRRQLASGPVPFHSFDQRRDYFRKRRLFLQGADDPAVRQIYDSPDPVAGQRLGFKVRKYRSGEMTGGCFFTGSRSTSSPPPSRSGSLVSTDFTPRARVKIRRSTECSPVDLRYFVTLTFSPRHLMPWHFRDDGTVRHDYAKHRLKQFLNTLSVTAYRRDLVNFVGPVLPGHGPLRLQYVWVAELQKNGNIHFHVLLSKFFSVGWLGSVWGQANNSVDVKRLDDIRHAVNYMRKYLVKDENSRIEGNRYFITRGLHESMQPDEEIISACHPADSEFAGVQWGSGYEIQGFLRAAKLDIERRGGCVLDWGFSLPPPRRPRPYRCKKTGKMLLSRGVSRDLSRHVLALLSLAVGVSPF